MQAAKGPGSSYERLVVVCRLVTLEPWAEMVCTLLGSEFLETCELIDPEGERLSKGYIRVRRLFWATTKAQRVFLLAMDGLFVGKPLMEVLEQRTKFLAARFASTKRGVPS